MLRRRVCSLVWDEKSYAVWTVSLFFTLLAGISTRTDFRSAAFYVSSFFSPPHMMALMAHSVLEINFGDVLALRKTSLLPGFDGYECAFIALASAVSCTVTYAYVGWYVDAVTTHHFSSSTILYPFTHEYWRGVRLPSRFMRYLTRAVCCCSWTGVNQRQHRHTSTGVWACVSHCFEVGECACVWHELRGANRRAVVWQCVGRDARALQSIFCSWRSHSTHASSTSGTSSVSTQPLLYESNASCRPPPLRTPNVSTHHAHSAHGASVPPAIVLDRVCATLSTKWQHNLVLENINLSVHPGEILFIMGSKASGKSCLLELMGYVTLFDGTAAAHV